MLLNFIANSNVYIKWLPLITVLLGAGMRIGEATALCWEDCDFEQDIIRDRKTMSYVCDDTGMVLSYHVSKV